MPSVLIPASVVSVPATYASVVQVVGGPNPLASEDDATYVDYTTFHVDNRCEVTFPATALPAGVMPDVVDLVYRVRGPASLVRPQFSYSPPSSSSIVSATGSTAPADHSWITGEYPDVPFITTAQVAAGEVGVSVTPWRMWVRATPGGGITAEALLQISYLALRIHYVDDEPIRRTTPRDDLRRTFPSTRSLQSSNRTGGAYL